MAESKFNALGIIALVGALLMVVGVFLNWVEITGTILGFSSTETMTGWDIINEEDAGEIFEYSFAPIAVLILGIVSLLFTIVPMVKIGKAGKALGALSLLLAIIAVILCVLFLTDVTSGVGGEYASLTSSAGAGLYLSLVGGIVVVIGEMLNLVKKTA